jgi:hypothetical protein
MRISAKPLLSGEVRSDAEGRVAAPDPSWMATGVLSLWACGNARALPKQGGGFRYRGGTWQRVDAHLAFCPGLKHVHGVPRRSVGYRQ